MVQRKSYFISDLHLGADAELTSREREALVLRWLDMIAHDCSQLFLVGDTFDYWFEYKNVVPKGYHRLIGRLALMADAGVKITIFAGNHDMWMKDYFATSLGWHVIMDELVIDLDGKRFFIAHGDGLGPGDYKYKVFKKVMRNSICQIIFSWIPPAIGLYIMKSASKTSRKLGKDEVLGQIEEEWLVQYCETLLKTANYDYMVFGHRHIPIQHTLSNGHSQYVNLGDWLNHFTYGVWDGHNFSIHRFKY